ncbi:CheR family methyltransferase [Telmatospirillum sp.]|uniref:CheR family methyltransferase n=1 Tax=Telmatospirillum sp. TaxID=2079197 RepID=UPI00284ADA7F|nr:CheR family methyltransferase [Telmatospirillum sp.]MDR3437361.1 CheR family methyltransferase [Telmatospirillum sp.]
MIAGLDLVPYKEQIKQRCGLVLEGLAEETLISAIHRRMTATGVASPAAYFGKVMGQEDEFQEFVTLMTITETYFYREPEQLALLVDKVIPGMLAEQGTGLPIRILSAGCSTGEEPYSIAMALLERFGEAAPRMFEILGGDINLHALAKARAGRYNRFSFRGLPPDLRARYFRRLGRDGFELAPQVSAMVSFHHFNLLAESFPQEFSNLDVVFFRNVSIYFDEPTRRTIQNSFRRVMTDRGHLVIGSAETLANDLGVFRMVEDGGAFYFVAGTVPEKERPVSDVPFHVQPSGFSFLAPSPVRHPVSDVAVVTARNGNVGQQHRGIAQETPATVPLGVVEVILDLIRDKKFDDAQVLLKQHNRVAQPDATLLVLEGYIRMMGRDFEAAEQLCAQALAADEWSVDAMVLRGLVAKWRDQHDESIRWLKQAVYCRQDCWPAHYYLGEMYRSGAQVDLARRCYRAALQQIEARPDPDGGLILPLGLPVPEVRFLCERHADTAARAGR